MELAQNQKVPLARAGLASGQLAPHMIPRRAEDPLGLGRGEVQGQIGWHQALGAREADALNARIAEEIQLHNIVAA